MTTIAYRDGVLASDSRETASGSSSYVITDKSKKVHRVHTTHGRTYLYASCGSSEQGEMMRRSIMAGQEPPELEEVEALLVCQLTGRYWLYEGHIWIEVTEPFFAIGSGAT